MRALRTGEKGGESDHGDRVLVPRSTDSVVRFEVRGMPQTQGSMRAFIPKGWKRAIVTHVKGEKLKSWRGLIMDEAQKVAPAQPLEGALAINVIFWLPRPRGHFGTGKNANVLRASAPMYPSGKPDADKLMRALGDAIKGVIYRDDAQLVEIHAWKEYGTPGAIVEVWQRAMQ